MSRHGFSLSRHGLVVPGVSYHDKAILCRDRVFPRVGYLCRDRVSYVVTECGRGQEALCLDTAFCLVAGLGKA